MAFEQQIEADRVDDLGFFATFLRAPVVGSLMWILGGDQAKLEAKREEEMRKKMDSIGDSSSGECTKSMVSEESSRSYALKDGMERTESNSGSMKRMPPRLIGSDISEFADCATMAEEDVHGLVRNSSITGSQRSASLTETKKQTRSLSWSDESGRDLVEYMGETRPAENLLIQPSGAAPKPIKSAMRRSRSVRANASTLEGESSDMSRYLPKGLGGDHHGLVIPTHPFDPSGQPPKGASFSPEWGWYITTTPPTPEMYQSHQAKKEEASPREVAQAPQPALVHQKFSKALKPPAGKTMGWPGVPL